MTTNRTSRPTAVTQTKPAIESSTRQLKRHCVVQLFVNEETDVYVYDLEDGVHVCAGIGNVELLGSLDRVDELISTLSRHVAAVRADPGMLERWRAGGRVGHPNLTTLAGSHTHPDDARRDHGRVGRPLDDPLREETGDEPQA